jgi:hypothetical protein
MRLSKSVLVNGPSMVLGRSRCVGGLRSNSDLVDQAREGLDDGLELDAPEGHALDAVEADRHLVAADDLPDSGDEVPVDGHLRRKLVLA